MTAIHSMGVPRYITLRLFFKPDGELEEVMLLDEKHKGQEKISSPLIDIPFEEFNASMETMYAAQIDINGGKFDGGVKIVILQDPIDKEDEDE